MTSWQVIQVPRSGDPLAKRQRTEPSIMIVEIPVRIERTPNMLVPSRHDPPTQPAMKQGRSWISGGEVWEARQCVCTKRRSHRHFS